MPTTDLILVRPRRGLILDGIPAKGAEIPRALAEEWINDQLVERIEPATPAAAEPPAPRRTTEAIRPKQQRSTR